MARQRHCRRLARNGKPAASLLTPSSSEPRTPAEKARVLDARKWLRERDGLSAGGRWIRTVGPPSAATPSATANHLSSHHLPRQLGLRFAPKASNPSRKSSDLPRPVFKIQPKPRRQLHDPLLPAKRRTGHVVLGIDRLTSHAAQMDLPRPGPEEVFPRHRGEGRLDPRVPDAKCHFLRQA